MRYVRRALLLALLVALALWQEPASAANCSFTGILNMYDFEQVTVSTTSIGFTEAKYDQAAGQAQYALALVETNAIRWRSDGAAPTASVGSPVSASQSIEICGFDNIKKFRAIRQSADATVSVSYFR